METFIKNGNLIDKGEWEKYIASIQTGFDSLETNKERAKRQIKEAIEKAVISRSKGLEKFGILFSGGVDSTLIAFLCKKYNLNFNCYAIGIENSQDIEYARIIAQKYNLNLKYKILSLEEFEKVIKETIKILDSNDIVWVSVGSVLYAASKLALQDNIKKYEEKFGTISLAVVPDQGFEFKTE